MWKISLEINLYPQVNGGIHCVHFHKTPSHSLTLTRSLTDSLTTYEVFVV